MPPKQQAAMYRYDDRVASFQPISKPKSRARHGWPLTTDTHPFLTPENMAHAGFFFSPGSSDASYDTCVCFLCGVRLGGWAEDDDPWAEHVSRGDCAWAETVCQVELDKRAGRVATYATPDDLPSSSTSSRVRENTFYSEGRETCWWPHPEDEFGPTPSTLAQAGFVFTPTATNPDLVKCILCEYEVEGWEPEDDPLDIHRTKNSDCPFFTSQAQSQAQAKGKSKRTNKAKQKAESEAQPPETTGKGHSRSNSRSQPTASASADASAGPGTRTRQQTSEAPSEPTRPSRSTRSRPKRAGKQTDDEVEVIDVVEEDEEHEKEEVEDQEEEEPIKSKQPRRAKAPANGSKSKSSRKGKKAVEVETEAESEPQPETELDLAEIDQGQESQETGGLQADGDDTDNGETKQPEPVPKPRGKTASKSSRKTIKADVPPPPTDEVDLTATEAEDAKGTMDDAAPPKRTTSKSNSKSKSKSTPTVIDDETEVEVQNAPAETATTKAVRKPRVTKSSKKQAEATEARNQIQSSTVGIKPLPPLPAPAPSPRPLSQLERFTNLPSSPQSAPTLASTSRPTKAIPVKKSLSQPTGRVAQAVPLETGARAARQVVEASLTTIASIPTSTSTPTPALGPAGQGLSPAQLDMTLEQWIRAEMSRKRTEIESEGRNMIRAFEQRTKEGRRRIEAIPTR